jgi:hypothetical protein
MNDALWAGIDPVLISLLVVLVAVVYLSFVLPAFQKRSNSQSITDPLAMDLNLVQYFMAHHRCQLFITVPKLYPKRWNRVVQVKGELFICSSGEAYPLEPIQSYILAYPSGEIAYWDHLFYPLPPQVYFQDVKKPPQGVLHTLNDSQLGAKYLKIQVQESPLFPTERGQVSIHIQNVSSVPVRVVEFAKFERHQNQFLQVSMTFSERQFMERFGLFPEGAQDSRQTVLLPPGKTVVQPALYTESGSCWGFSGVTQEGEAFWAPIII